VEKGRKKKKIQEVFSSTYYASYGEKGKDKRASKLKLDAITHCISISLPSKVALPVNTSSAPNDGFKKPIVTSKSIL